MNRVSAKNAREIKRLAPERKAYLGNHLCVLCDGVPDDVHEVVGGAFRQRTKVLPRYWIATCRLCHDKLQHMPRAKQFALKLLRQPETFDVAALTEYPGRFTSAEDVLTAVRKLLLELSNLEQESDQ